MAKSLIQSEFTYINNPAQKLHPKRSQENIIREDVNTPTVLLVDDNDLVLEALQAFLEEEQYRIVTASHGEAALELFSENAHTIKAAVIDDCMPGMSGMELLKKIHEIKPEVKFILTSGYYGDDFRGPTLDEKWAIFLHKPYEISTVLQKLREFLTPT